MPMGSSSTGPLHKLLGSSAQFHYLKGLDLTENDPFLGSQPWAGVICEDLDHGDDDKTGSSLPLETIPLTKGCANPTQVRNDAIQGSYSTGTCSKAVGFALV